MRALDDGKSFIISRNGTPVGELRPLRRQRFVAVSTVVEMFRGAPPVDLASFSRDLDDLVGQDIDQDIEHG